MQKIFYNLFLGAGIIGLVSCSGSSYWTNNEDVMVSDEKIVYPQVENNTMFMSNPEVDARVFNKRIPDLNSLLVCRDKQCAPAEMSTAKQYVFNALAHLVDNNADTTALLCEANPQAHVCVNPYLTIPAKIGVTPSYVYFDGVKLIDAAQVKGKTALNLVLGYNLSYNGQTPFVCKPDKAVLYVKNNNNIVLNGNGFECDMTSMGTTNIRAMFSIDYIDMDYGYLGGYYSIGMSGPAYGGGSGYAMIRLPKDAHPLKPNLRAPEEEEEVAPKVEQKATYRPEVKEELINHAKEEVAEVVEEEIEDVKDTVEDVVEDTVEEVNNNLNSKEYVTVSDDISASLNGGKNNSNGQPTAIKGGRQALTIPEDAVVTSNKLILKPESNKGNIVRVNASETSNTSEEYEEINVEDLEEYIK
ncbi:MAG: hypothetical protein IKW39_00210 [Alphaproteobacteria bacterium]|nr:hypothetical protein [Alphaproteobacteria bacterium]